MLIDSRNFPSSESNGRREPSGQCRGTGWPPVHWAWLALLVALGVILAFPDARSVASAPTEYQVKAAYLYNFGKFVQWPANATAGNSNSFPICVLGQDPFGKALDSAIVGESINGKNVVARRIAKTEEAANCRVLFISSSESSGLGRILSALDDASLLTVSDMPDFAQRGGMIHLLLQDQRVRFEVNLDAATRVGLTLSSQLLKLAVTVRTMQKSGE